MRRILAAIAAFLMLLTLSCVPAAAEAGQLSLAYVPPAERGTLFSLDVSYDGSLSAAMLELSFDRKLAEYRDVEAAADTARVKAQADGDTLKIVFGAADRVSGRLFRLTFKAIGSGSMAFTLRMTEGVDGDLQYVALPPACTLNVTVSVGSSSHAPSSSGDGGRSFGGSGSTKSNARASSADATGDEQSERTVRDLRSLRENNSTLIIIGVAAGTCAALLAVFGFMVGRRSRKKKKPADENSGEEENE